MNDIKITWNHVRITNQTMNRYGLPTALSMERQLVKLMR